MSFGSLSLGRLSLGRAGRAPGAGGGADPLAPIIADAIAVWDVSTGYESATRKVIKNKVATVTDTDPNLGYLPRRAFAANLGGFGPASNLTITDNATTAPDGSTEASTITSASSLDWFHQFTITLPAGTYTTAISVKDLGASSADFRLDGVAKTASGSWGRFSATFVHAGGSKTIMLRAPVGNSQANFAICDWEIFAGSSDLNANALTAKPLFCQSQDLMLGKGDGDSGISVSGGVVAASTTAQVMLPDTANLSAFTILYVAKKTAAPSISNFMPAVALLGNSYSTFCAGPGGYPIGTNGATGFYTAGRSATGVYSGSTKVGLADLFTPLNGDFIVGCHRGNASAASSWLNGHKVLQEGTLSAIAPAGRLAIMSSTPGAATAFRTSGLSWTWAALWDRVLTDEEIQTASEALIAANSVPKRLIGYIGTSITSQGANDNIGASLTIPWVGFNFGIPGEGVSGASSRAAALDAVLTSGPAITDSLLVVELGANDLNIATPNPAAFTAALAAYIDARLAAGWAKVIATTIMPRTDAGGASDTDFNTARATANATILSWVGGRLAAVADWAADPIMGSDGASDNATYFGDKVHPTAAGNTRLGPITAVAINSV